MKNKIKSLLLAGCVCFCITSTLSVFTSCSDDADTNYGPSFTTAAQQEAQGTYSGTFIRVQAGTDEALESQGTFSIIATDTLNRAHITFASDDMQELGNTDPVPINIAHADNGFTFYNKSGDAALYGRISESGILTVSFTKAVRSGRKTVRYNYNFNGNRQ